MLYQPWADPRLIDGGVFVPPIDALFTNSVRSRGRGVEFRVQRSNQKGLTGWLSYAYRRTMDHDLVTGAVFPSDWDQRHTANAYLSYRLHPSVNLSSRWTYGSGFPVPGHLAGNDAGFLLSDQRNSVRLGPYQRLDFRVNKEWTREHWKTTLYAEVMNITNKTNQWFGSLDAYSTNAPCDAYVRSDTMFPILPAVGVVIRR